MAKGQAKRALLEFSFFFSFYFVIFWRNGIFVSFCLAAYHISNRGLLRGLPTNPMYRSLPCPVLPSLSSLATFSYLSANVLHICLLHFFAYQVGLARTADTLEKIIRKKCKVKTVKKLENSRQSKTLEKLHKKLCFLAFFSKLCSA